MATRTDNDDQNRAHPSPPSPVHDIVTGGIEGGVGVLGLEPALKKIAGETVENPFRPGLIKRVTGAGLIGAASTGLIGALVSATSKKAKQRKQQPVNDFERLQPGMIEFDAYDPMSDRSLKSGVRLDKYRKGIRAHEIDRHIHDYLRSAAIGAAAGAVIPGRAKLKTRAAVGAGGGTLVAGVLHGVGHEDPYGEQSEDAKLTQRNVPKVAGAAAIVGGLVARYRKKKAVTDAVAGGLQPSFWTGVNRIRKAVSVLGSKPSV